MYSSASSGCKLINNVLIFNIEKWSLCSLWLLIGQMVIVDHHRGNVRGVRLPLGVPLPRTLLIYASYRSEVHQLCNLHITNPWTGCSMGGVVLLKILIFVKKMYVFKRTKKVRNCNFMKVFKAPKSPTGFSVHFTDICTNIGFGNLPFLSIYFVKNTRFPLWKHFQPSLLSVSTENSFLKLWFLQDFQKTPASAVSMKDHWNDLLFCCAEDIHSSSSSSRCLWRTRCSSTTAK